MPAGNRAEAPLQLNNMPCLFVNSLCSHHRKHSNTFVSSANSRNIASSVFQLVVFLFLSAFGYSPARVTNTKLLTTTICLQVHFYGVINPSRYTSVGFRSCFFFSCSNHKLTFLDQHYHFTVFRACIVSGNQGIKLGDNKTSSPVMPEVPAATLSAQIPHDFLMDDEPDAEGFYHSIRVLCPAADIQQYRTNTKRTKRQVFSESTGQLSAAEGGLGYKRARPKLNSINDPEEIDYSSDYDDASSESSTDDDQDILIEEPIFRDAQPRRILSARSIFPAGQAEEQANIQSIHGNKNEASQIFLFGGNGGDSGKSSTDEDHDMLATKPASPKNLQETSSTGAPILPITPIQQRPEHSFDAAEYGDIMSPSVTSGQQSFNSTSTGSFSFGAGIDFRFFSSDTLFSAATDFSSAATPEIAVNLDSIQTEEEASTHSAQTPEESYAARHPLTEVSFNIHSESDVPASSAPALAEPSAPTATVWPTAAPFVHRSGPDIAIPAHGRITRSSERGQPLFRGLPGYGTSLRNAIMSATPTLYSQGPGEAPNYALRSPRSLNARPNLGASRPRLTRSVSTREGTSLPRRQSAAAILQRDSERSRLTSFHGGGTQKRYGGAWKTLRPNRFLTPETACGGMAIGNIERHQAGRLGVAMTDCERAFRELTPVDSPYGSPSRTQDRGPPQPSLRTPGSGRLASSEVAGALQGPAGVIIIPDDDPMPDVVEGIPARHRTSDSVLHRDYPVTMTVRTAPGTFIRMPDGNLTQVASAAPAHEYSRGSDGKWGKLPEGDSTGGI